MLSIAEDADIEHWLEALSFNECTQDELVREMARREAGNPDAIWEALALLDQYFRRSRISREVFISVKDRLQHHSLGIGRGPAAGAGNPGVVARTPPPAQPVVEQAPARRGVGIGDMLCGRYRVVDILRRDDSGTVIEAIDQSRIELPQGRHRRHRIDMHVLDDARSRDPGLLQRISGLRELSHPGIARVTDVCEDHGAMLITMELSGGASLQELLDHISGQRLPAPFVVTLFRVVASALVHAHSRGVPHGAVNAANIRITCLGDVLLQGFQLSGRDQASGMADDRLAFARMVYALLSGPATPRAVTRRQWRIVRDTLKGKEQHSQQNVLTAFAENADPARPSIASPIFMHTPVLQRRTHAAPWLTACVLAAMLGAGGYYLAAAGPEWAGAASEPVPSTSQAPDPPRVQTPPPLPAPAEAPGEPMAEDSPLEPVAQPQRPLQTSWLPRIEVSTDSIWAETTDSFARIWVGRRGDLSRSVSFQWRTEAGSAQDGRDFRAIALRTDVIPPGARGVELLVPLLPDPARLEPRTFQVVIDSAGAGASPGDRTSARVAIVPPGYPAAR